MAIEEHRHVIDPYSSPLPITDIVVVVLIVILLLSSISAVSFIVHFHLTHLSITRLRDLNSLWSVRALLIFFSCLWALAEILSLPHLLHLVLSTSNLYHYHLCWAYVLTSHAFAEPCFFTTLLFLLQASLDDYLKPKDQNTNAFVSALIVCFCTSFPFFLLHLILLSPSTAWALNWLGILPETFARVVDGMGQDDSSPAAMRRCSYPLFSTMLLACFGSVYVPWFVSVCWTAVSVVINKKLRVRIYALAASVVAALSFQVAAFAFTAFWNPNDAVFQGLGLIGFLAVFNCALVGQGVLVVIPIRDAMEVGFWCRSSGGGEVGSGGDVPCSGVARERLMRHVR